MLFFLGVWLSALVGLGPASPVLNDGRKQEPLPSKPGMHTYDLEPTAEYAFAGIPTFHRLPKKECLQLPPSKPIDDFLVVGVPFDTATSYRVGTRFGPNGIRQGSRAVSLIGGYSYRQKVKPFSSWASVVDCGDLPVSPFDNALALAQIEEWYFRLLSHPTINKSPANSYVSRKTNQTHPTILALGGDHSISLPILRALRRIYGRVSIVHLDAHIDTWSPDVFAGAHGAPSHQAAYSDGTPFFHAAIEGLITPTGNIHAGIRSPLDSEVDLQMDERSGFTIIPASDILSEGGIHGIIAKIREAVPHDTPVYLSLDVDCLDPAFAPGTAGPSAGGWTTREVLQIIIDGLGGMKVVGADLVEVLPGLDSPGEVTAVAAAELAFEILGRLIKNGMADVTPASRSQAYRQRPSRASVSRLVG